MRLALHGVLACTLLLAGVQAASAGLHRRRDPIQCCHTRASGATRCRVRTLRACRRYGGVDMGPGTCHPNPCGGAAATLPTSDPTTTQLDDDRPLEHDLHDGTRLRHLSAE